MELNLSAIRVLEKENNKIGDLFARLMQDLFHALGYDSGRLNIQKSGREIDLEALHRTERRKVIAECKATEEKIGGDEINKFVGSLDVEKRKGKELSIEGYFVSLSGFKETAIEQEKDAGGDRVILLNGKQVVEELIKGKIIISPFQAVERAGRCAVSEDVLLKAETSYELLAHELGWIWLIYFTKNKKRTHFALIHADGEAIASNLAKQIIDDYKLTIGEISSVTYLKPDDDIKDEEKVIDDVKKKYYKYLESECGEITLEGLPADQEAGCRRLRLENIFVPLHVERIDKYKAVGNKPLEV